MNKTILFFLALMLVTTTACGRGNSNNNPVKEETMATEGDGKVIHLTKAEFLAKVYNFEKNPEEWKYEGDKPAIVDFYADWCGPCKMIAPILDEIADEYQGKLTVAKLNIDQNPGTAPKYGIRGIPTLLLFKNGDVAATKVGALSKGQLKEFLDANLA